MFVACGIWCLADVSSISPSSEQTLNLNPDVLELTIHITLKRSPDRRQTLRSVCKFLRTSWTILRFGESTNQNSVIV